MNIDVETVRYLGGHTLEVKFKNGKQGTVDLSGFIRKGGVFSRFAELDYFQQVRVNPELGVLCWPGDVDIAPETLYHLVTGEPLPAWMESD